MPESKPARVIVSATSRGYPMLLDEADFEDIFTGYNGSCVRNPTDKDSRYSIVLERPNRY